MTTNSMTNDKILDAVYDLASACDMRIDEFVSLLQEQFGDPEFETEGLPEDVVAELQNAKALRKESRDAKRKAEAQSKQKEEIAAFCERFPDVRAEQIPAPVWEEVASGMDLPHAYAYYLVTEGKANGHADEVNRGNMERSAAAQSDGSTEPSFSREEVERMSQKDVAKNYKNILHSMKKWKF